VRIGIYNRHWSTLGGGERYGGGIAEVLAVHNEVDLIAHAPLDLGTVGERLRLDLSGVGVHVISMTDPDAVVRASSEYDLFVNVSFMSHDRSEAARSIYVVHFPSPFGRRGWVKRAGITALRPLVLKRPHAPSRWGKGFYPSETGRLGQRRTWTAGEAEFFVDVPTGLSSTSLEILFTRDAPPVLGPRTAQIEVDGTVVSEIVVPPSRRPMAPPLVARIPIRRRDDGEPSRVVIRSDTWVPASLVGGSDTRDLGVRIAGIRFDRSVAARLGWRYPGLLVAYDRVGFLASYSHVVSNSRFTQRYVREWWDRDSDVLYPPVRMQPRGHKRPIILSVGRFFAGTRGHSKKQLEMVEAFRRLHERGLAQWEFHLVGGCTPTDRPYLDRVRAAAKGLPVHFHIGATGGEITELYGAASIFWSATGLGENYEREPARFEHFGITTVESMSAGAVPIVLARGGQPEIVRDGVDGFLFETLDDMVATTEKVATDEGLRHRLSASAESRARAFAMDVFGARLQSIVDEVVGAPQ
jgi:glycosyltransferase involved in cell wall biosynthesis